ncbi:MAG TPA: hypothetical protein VFP65_06115 [Anaeromyxobacteraceae bacterium]|nr:hypothetical protein [Anaeromyxobacteraceae bacterium]
MLPARAPAQQQTQGFAVERLYLAAPGNGWFVTSDLNQGDELGGMVSLSTGYAAHPLDVSEPGSASLSVVRAQAFATVGLGVAYGGVRVFGHFASPVYGTGSSGTVDGRQFTAPSVNLEQEPDTLSDVHVGVDVRLLGKAESPARAGVALRLVVPSGQRSSYVSDGSYRAMGLVAFAGDTARWRYAAQAGIHVRPLDDTPAPGSPRGSELVFGVAAARRLRVAGAALSVGPEIFGASALREFGSGEATGVEALLTGRVDLHDSLLLKIGAGGALHHQFGAPSWRSVISVEYAPGVPGS